MSSVSASDIFQNREELVSQVFPSGSCVWLQGVSFQEWDMFSKLITLEKNWKTLKIFAIVNLPLSSHTNPDNFLVGNALCIVVVSHG